MTINYYGNSCVAITAKPGIGDVTTVLDPFDNATGLKLPRTLSGDVVFSSSEGAVHGNKAAVAGSPFDVSMPGEFEVKGVMMDARIAPTKTSSKNMILRVNVEGVTVGFLGGLDRVPTDKELEVLEGVDILILPIGGGPVMTPKIAAETMRAVEPRVVIPVHGDEKGLKEKLQPVSAFVKEVGSIRTEEGSKFKITKAKLPQDDMLLVLLSRS